MNESSLEKRDIRVMMVSHWLSWWRSGFFFWSIIALLYYVNFCCTMKFINYTYTYIHSLLRVPPPHWIITEHWASSQHYTAGPTRYLLYNGSVSTSDLISWLIPPSLSPMSTHPFSRISVSALGLGLSVPFFWILHKCVTDSIFSFLLHCDRL